MKKICLVVFTAIVFICIPVFTQTWFFPKRLTYSGSHSSVGNVAVDSSNNVYAVWYESITGNSEIFFKKSTDGGTTWSSRMRLTWALGYSSYPMISIDNSDILYLIWSDNKSGFYDLYLKKSTNKGTNWGPV